MHNVWVLCTALLSWVINIFGWLLIGWLWTQELFGPENIRATLGAFGWILVWALLVFLIFYMWTRHKNGIGGA